MLWEPHRAGTQSASRVLLHHGVTPGSSPHRYPPTRDMGAAQDHQALPKAGKGGQAVILGVVTHLNI